MGRGGSKRGREREKTHMLAFYSLTPKGFTLPLEAKGEQKGAKLLSDSEFIFLMIVWVFHIRHNIAYKKAGSDTLQPDMPC